MEQSASHAGEIDRGPQRLAADPRPSDVMLLGRVARGERAAFEELFDRFVAPVHGLVLAIVDDADRAAEVVAAVFVDLWRSPTDLLSTPGETSQGVATRILAAAHRRAVQAARVHRQDSSGGGAWDQRSPRPAARLLDCISDPDAVTAIGLAYFDARTIGEVAGRMEMPPSRVASLLNHGLEGLRRSSGTG